MKPVDITAKIESLREAKAYGRIRLKPETVNRIKNNQIPKGNLMEATKLSGIFGAKRTGELLPFCHPIPIDHVVVEVKLGENYLEAYSTVRGIAKTGYEMEALTAVSVALLNVYDMCKSIDDSMVIEEIKLLEKSGGKSDWFADLKGVKASVHSEDEELKKLVEEHLRNLGATLSESGDVYISVGENIPFNAEVKSFESVIALYDFRRNPTKIGSEIKVGKTEEGLIIIFPEDKEKIDFFFTTFGGILRHILCKE